MSIIYWSERSACAVCRQNKRTSIFFSQKRLKKIGPSKVHAPEQTSLSGTHSVELTQLNSLCRTRSAELALQILLSRTRSAELAQQNLLSKTCSAKLPQRNSLNFSGKWRMNTNFYANVRWPQHFKQMEDNLKCLRQMEDDLNFLDK